MLIPYNNPKALISYYCGVFGLIPVVGLALGPVAFILGILGLRDVKAHPEIQGTAHAIVGMVLALVTLSYHAVILVMFGAVFLAREFK